MVAVARQLSYLPTQLTRISLVMCGEKRKECGELSSDSFFTEYPFFFALVQTVYVGL